ncbi:hypothetical protein RYX36_004868 [Vicia faba]
MAKRFSGELSTVVFAEKSFTSSPLTIEELRLNRNFLISDEANAQLRALEFFATLVSSGLSNMGTGKHCWDCLSTPKLSLKMVQFPFSCAQKYVIQMKAVIDEGFIPVLIDLVKNKFDIRYEAAWAVYSVSCGSFKQTRYLLHIEVTECVKGLCNLLSFTSDPKLLDVCLNGLNNFLIQGDMLRKKSTANIYAETIKNDQTFGLRRLWSLKDHNNEEISYLAVKIFEEYWSSERGQMEM